MNAPIAIIDLRTLAATALEKARIARDFSIAMDAVSCPGGLSEAECARGDELDRAAANASHELHAALATLGLTGPVLQALLSEGVL